MPKKIIVICLSFILALAILPRLTLAQSTGYLESRISRIEADNSQLRSQVANLESQVYRLSSSANFPRQATNAPVPRPSPSPTPARGNRARLSQDPMFDRLANLVIELKERVQALETQVAELKRQRR